MLPSCWVASPCPILSEADVESVYFPERTFQVWAYTVGMGRLLIRSTKSATFPTRVDVLFQNVKAMKLPTRLDGLVVRLADEVERRAIESETGLLTSDDTKPFVIEGTGYVGYIVAGVIVSHEDAGEYNDESALLKS